MRSLTKLLLVALLVVPAVARADWLNLSDGMWDLTLSCDFVDPNVSCPGSFHASLTISGAGASALGTVFNNESFSGDPADIDFTHMGITHNVSRLYNPGGTEFDVAYESDSPTFGLPAQGWSYCVPGGLGCFLTYGSWTAVAVNPVPEPGEWALIAVGLSGMAAMGRRRRCRGGSTSPAP